MQRRPKSAKAEASIHARVADHIKIKWPFVVFHTDYAAGLKMTIGQSAQNKRLQSGRGYPDLTILEPVNGLHGLLIELKREDSSNPIFYINYAHARINQIFAKAGKNVADIVGVKFANLSEEGKNLLFEALTLNDILVDSFNTRSMNKICDYLKSLAANFHKFYNENRVVGSENEDELLKLFAVVALSIKTALGLMGIAAKDKM